MRRLALSRDAPVRSGDVFMCTPTPKTPQEPMMGYGNPLFDGDQPLPPRHPRQRILSMRLWLGAVLAGTLGEGTGLPDRHDDEDRGGRATENQWRESQREWNQRR